MNAVQYLQAAGQLVVQQGGGQILVRAELVQDQRGRAVLARAS